MNLKDFLAGINILSPYYDKPDGYCIGAEHDQFYMYATDRPLTPEDAQKMVDLNWFQEDSDRDDDGNLIYDDENGWSAFT